MVVYYFKGSLTMSSDSAPNIQSNKVQKVYILENQIKKEEGKLVVPVKIGSDIYDVTVGYNKESLQEQYEIKDVESTILKIIEKINSEDIIRLVGKTIKTNLEFNDIRVKDLDAHTFTPVDKLDLALKETVNKVIDIFRNYIVGGGKKLETQLEFKVSKVPSKPEVPNPISLKAEEKPPIDNEDISDENLIVETKPLSAANRPTLSYEYKDKGEEYAKERLVEDDVISGVLKYNKKKSIHLKSLIGACEAGISTFKKDKNVLLDKYLGQAPLSEEAQKNIKKRNQLSKNIEGLRAQIEKAEEEIKTREKNINNAKIQRFVSNKSYLDSGYTRGVLTISKTHEEARKTFVSAPINGGYHEIELLNPDHPNNVVDKVGFYQCGILHDPRNGFTSLKELQEIKKEIDQGNSKPLDKKVTELEKRMKKLNKKGGTTKQIEALEFALQQFKIVNNITDKDERLKILGKIIKDRKDFLASQFICLLMTQIDNNMDSIEKLKNGEDFTLFHLALLNIKKKEFKENGWGHFEENMMQDMYAIFKEFDGYTLVFDGTGPFDDADTKTIYCPELKDVNRELKKIKLSTIFMNTSVQGHKKNDGSQAEINTEALNKLMGMLRKKEKIENDRDKKKVLTKSIRKLKGIRSKLEDKKKSNFFLAEDIMTVVLNLKKEGIAVSQGCLSTKDRGGILGVRACMRQLKKHLKKFKNFKFLWQKFQSKLFSKKHLVIQNIKKNTGYQVAKISARRIPGISAPRRVLEYLKVMMASMPWKRGVKV